MFARSFTPHASQALLGSIVSEPDAPIERLAIVDAEERTSLLQAFNATDLAPTDLLHPGQTLHGLVEHWAAATPDKTAVTFEASTHRFTLMNHLLECRSGLKPRSLVLNCRIACGAAAHAASPCFDPSVCRARR